MPLMSLPPLVARTLVADRGDAGKRLDLVLRRHLADLESATRTRVQSWIEGGQVTVNGALAERVSRRTAFGDRLTVLVPERRPPGGMQAEDLPLRILFEDDHFL